MVGDRDTGVKRVSYGGFQCPSCKVPLLVGEGCYIASEDIFEGLCYACLACAREKGLVW